MVVGVRRVRIAVTGAGGFLGRRLVRTLLDRGRIGADGPVVTRVVAFDRVAPDLPEDPRLQVRTGDVADAAAVAPALAEADLVFHLAAVVSAQAEADYELGMRVNLDGTRAVLEALRRTGRRPRLVFASSVAVYGGPLPDPVGDDVPLAPQSSYGAQKAMGELLVADGSRRGFVDGVSLRLPTVVVRPGRPNRAASAFASSILREPLTGRGAVCPVPPDTALYLTSPRRVVEAFLHAATLPEEALPMGRAFVLPGLTVTVAEMLAALGRVGGAAAVARVRFVPDETVARIVRGWPARFEAATARRLGFAADPDMDSILHAFVEDELGGAPA